MTTVTFEAATLADSIKKAVRVAPTKVNDTFDKSWGIVLDIYPDEDVKCVVRVTNMDVFYTEAVTALEASGPSARWRLPSQPLASILNAIPVESGKTVTFKQEGSQIKITSGRLRAQLTMADGENYHDWKILDSSSMTTVSNFGTKLAQVEWATSKDRIPPQCGVHMDGEYLIGADRYTMSRTPCKVNILKPITFPANVLSSVIKVMGDTSLAVEGNLLLLSPDDYTQIQVITFDVPYLAINRVFSRTYPNRVELNKPQMLHLLSSAGDFAGADRSATVKLFIGRDELSAYMKKTEAGHLGNTIDCPGADHRRVELTFNPQMIVNAFSKCPTDNVVMEYDPTQEGPPVHLSSGSLEAWVAPLKNIPSGG